MLTPPKTRNVHQNQPLAPVISRMNQINVPKNSLKYILILPCNLSERSTYSLPLGVSDEFVIDPICAKYLVHLFIHVLIILIL